MRQIDSLSVARFVRDRLVPDAETGRRRTRSSPPSDRRGEAVRRRRRSSRPRPSAALAAAVADPGALARDPEPHDITVHGAAYRVTAARLADGTYVLLATSTDALHKGIAQGAQARSGRRHPAVGAAGRA